MAELLQSPVTADISLGAIRLPGETRNVPRRLHATRVIGTVWESG
jgi:hypothetical protein